LDIQSPLHRRFYVYFSGMIVSSDKCSALNDYVAANKGANMFVRLHNC